MFSLYSLRVEICLFWYFFQSSDYTKPGEIDPSSVTGPKDPEDIPTFDEWKKKVMEVEKEKSKETLWFFFCVQRVWFKYAFLFLMGKIKLKFHFY